MSNREFIFPEIDTSYWKTRDKAWMAQRKVQWEQIEPMLIRSKNSRAKAIIKQYFLKGKMPDWDKMRRWDGMGRHLDLFMFLWLHPSWDEALLTSLRDQYIFEDVTRIDDISQGFAIFTGQGGTGGATWDYTGKTPDELIHEIHTNNHNELLFRVMFGDLSIKEYELNRFDDLFEINRTHLFKLPQGELRMIQEMGRWLCIKEMHALNEDMLFQYDQPLEWWYQGCTKDEDHFRMQAQEKKYRAIIKKALYRIHHFRTDREGDTCRTRFVQKIRKILDEREFIDEFKQMWLDVKDGKIAVVQPWKLS